MFFTLQLALKSNVSPMLVVAREAELKEKVLLKIFEASEGRLRHALRLWKNATVS